MAKMSTSYGTVTFDELIDYRHPPVTMRLALGTSGTVKFGQVVKIGSDGSVTAAASGDAFYGIACENATQSADVTHVTVLVHGTVKAAKVLVGEVAAAEADVQKLKGVGIYVLN